MFPLNLVYAMLNLMTIHHLNCTPIIGVTTITFTNLINKGETERLKMEKIENCKPGNVIVDCRRKKRNRFMRNKNPI